MPEKRKPIRRDKKRNPEVTRAAILQAALEEFGEVGHSGARVDRIAERAGVSKPMIYDYFGDKDGIYTAALREAYVQIRAGEEELELDLLDPEAAIRALLRFTMDHFWRKPWFIRMLNTENLLGGDTIRKLDDAADIQSVLFTRLEAVLDQGVSTKVFRSDIDPVQLYLFIASVCYFPISNMHTLRVVFQIPITGEWLEQHADRASDMIVGYLKAPPKA
ncbi:TetR family transcriptional regulator [Alphaproteobacteria bacterium KMM 3653]|uniref:TetR family transcriptional regulator n=1 Tax=Harenicola maris TaxID=2841044 RepID=A0AAP2CRU0_9RHOB|nr:TetR family transcriptional regulator [Harenicola maris]